MNPVSSFRGSLQWTHAPGTGGAIQDGMTSCLLWRTHTANMLRKRIIDAESALPPKPEATLAPDMHTPGPTFVPLPLPAPSLAQKRG